jgi:hypothetical protein
MKTKQTQSLGAVYLYEPIDLLLLVEIEILTNQRMVVRVL